MKTLSAEDRSQIAAEYVLGTLRGPARQRFERMVQDDPRLWQEVAFWENRLGNLGEALPDVSPSARVWEAIEAEIGAERRLPIASRPDGLWQSTPFWRGFGLLAAGLAAVLLVIFVQPLGRIDLQPVQVATLQSEATGDAWLVRVAADGRADIAPIGEPRLPAGKSFELWLLRSNDQAPVSMGIAMPAAQTNFSVPPSIDSGTAFAISLEPAGGSPTGAPTGPVVFVGNLVGTRAN